MSKLKLIVQKLKLLGAKFAKTGGAKATLAEAKCAKVKCAKAKFANAKFAKVTCDKANFAKLNSLSRQVSLDKLYKSRRGRWVGGSRPDFHTPKL